MIKSKIRNRSWRYWNFNSGLRICVPQYVQMPKLLIQNIDELPKLFSAKRLRKKEMKDSKKSIQETALVKITNNITRANQGPLAIVQ